MNLINALLGTLNTWEKGYYELENRKISLQTSANEAETAVVLFPE